MKGVKDGVRGIAKSFRFAFRGLKFCILNERNMRIHIVVLLFVVYFAFLFELSCGEWAILCIAFAMVLVCEMINTAIEALVNLGAPAYDNIARVAKDVAAGAVLLTAFMAIVIGGILFIKPDKLNALLERLVEQPALALPFLLLLLIGPFFVLFGSRLSKLKKN
ncbi:MAG: diacylglycerol kinase family protein [Oscillospiraceae bacterium]|jgi:diacylglycerol kinase (ATP)